MRKSVKIFCSSSLAFKSSIWNNLKNKFNFSFQEFIDLENFSVSSLQNETNKTCLLVIYDDGTHLIGIFLSLALG